MGDPVVVESWHLPRALSDEALRLFTSLPMDEIERRLRMDGPAGHERPTDEELLRTYGLAKRIHNYEGPIDDWPKRAERAAVVAGLRAVLAHWGAAVGEVADPALRPIPVSERLPGPEDCVPHPRTKRGNWCWGFERCEVSLARPARWRLMHMETVEMEASHWLPAHALPLPEFDHE